MRSDDAMTMQKILKRAEALEVGRKELARRSGIEQRTIDRWFAGEVTAAHQANLDTAWQALDEIEYERRGGKKLRQGLGGLEAVLAWYAALPPPERKVAINALGSYEPDAVDRIARGAAEVLHGMSAQRESDPRTGAPARGRRTAG